MKLADELPIIPVDPEGMHRALLNVVGNALDAVEEGRSRRSSSARASPRTAGCASPWSITAPASPRKSSRRSSSRSSAPRAPRARGLGLAVSRKILREHGGDIQVQSQLGVGSKFTLVIPIKSPLHNDLGGSGSDIPLLPPEPD